MPASEYAIVGLIRKAQGIRGEVVVEPLTDKPDVIFASGSRVFAGTTNGDLAPAQSEGGVEEPPTLTIATSKPFKKGLIVQFEELSDRDSAELWRGRYLLAPFSELPPLEQDQVYLHDLVGMRVLATTGEELGTVATFYELPQGLILDVQTKRGTVMVPYRPEVIVRADLDERAAVHRARSRARSRGDPRRGRAGARRRDAHGTLRARC
jgi:16S rRNA processing protein RimM